MPEVTPALATLGTTAWNVNPNWNAANAVPVNPSAATWANRASFQTEVGRQVRFTDVGGGNPLGGPGTVMVWTGTRWKPLNFSTLLDAIDTPNAGAANTTEQQLNPTHAAILAGVMGDFDRLRLRLTFTKNGGTDSATLRLRYGPLGTVADPVIATIASLAASNQSYGTQVDFKRASATTLQKLGNADPSASYIGTSTAALPAPVVVSNMDSNAMYLSLTAQMTGGTEIPTLQDYTLELISAEI